MNPITRRRFLSSTALGVTTCAAGTAFAQSSHRYKLIGFTKPFQELGHDACADTVSGIGWDGVEVPVRPKGQIEPEKAVDELPGLLEALKKRGKEIGVVTTGITSASDPQTEPLLRLMSKLGVRRYRMGFFKYLDNKPIPDQVKEIAARLKDLAALNKEIGVLGGIQNHSGRDYFGAPVWDIWTAIKDLDPRHVGIFFDIGHAGVEGGLSWPIEARLMERHMMTVSVKDFAWEKTTQGSKTNWVPLGEGLLNKSFFDWLKTTGFNGPVSHHAEYDHGKGPEMIAKLQKDVKLLRQWLA